MVRTSSTTSRVASTSLQASRPSAACLHEGGQIGRHALSAPVIEPSLLFRRIDPTQDGVAMGETAESSDYVQVLPRLRWPDPREGTQNAGTLLEISS